MADAQDPEAGRPPNLRVNNSANDTPHPIPEDRDFQMSREKCISKFKRSKIHAEERLGILLLLKYKVTLDRLGEEYHKALFRGVGTCPVTTEAYIQARDLYESHLDRFPPPYSTRAAYEDFLTKEASGFVARTRPDLGTSILTPHQRKELEVAISLRLPEYQTWFPFLHPGFVSEFREEPGQTVGIEAQAAAKAFFRRSLFALAGGFALIIPMLIMKLYPTTLNVCLTTTLFVIAAALLMALFMKDTEPKDVLAMTAAYAAVLVVFVGTNTTTSGGDNKKVAIITGSIVGAFALLAGIYLILLRVWMLFMELEDALSRYR